MTEAPSIPVLVLGGSGYVAGELLRLLAGHPILRLSAIVSASRAGEPLVEAFPQLAASPLDGVRFAAESEIAPLLATQRELAVFSALPHGEAAACVDALLTKATASGCTARVVDLSADFRHRDPALYAAIYGRQHAAPARLADFACALPELERATPAAHVAHPGCFATAAALAIAPLLAGGWVEPRLSVVATTGSTGAGRALSTTTHHPERRSDLFAYSPLVHRHEPEMAALAGRAGGVRPEVFFVPQAGPFARGIHATVAARLARSATASELRAALSDFYREARFVRVLDSPPRLQAVAGTNRCDLGVAARDGQVMVFAAIDNLVKGAAGGAVQWMNRLFALPESTGLELPGLGWL